MSATLWRVYGRGFRYVDGAVRDCYRFARVEHGAVRWRYVAITRFWVGGEQG